MTITIPALRRRAWFQANRAIDALNELNAIIFEGSEKMPPKIEKIAEDMDNISLDYIQKAIDIFNSYSDEIKNKTEYLLSLQSKNNECMDALTQLIG
jgi:hypothetical protein